MRLLLLKVCQSFKFGHIKNFDVHFGLYESSFTFIEERRSNKYCLRDANLNSCMLVFSLMDQVVNLVQKISSLKCWLCFGYFCGGHKKNFRYDFVAPLR